MYKIYKVCGKGHFIRIFYSLCDENTTVIKWFYVIRDKCVSEIFHEISDDIKITYLLSLAKKRLQESNILDCIYESSDLQEASDYLEQLRILLSV